MGQNRVIIENGKVKTILNEETQNNGWMTVEEARNHLHEFANKLQECYGQK